MYLKDGFLYSNKVIDSKELSGDELKLFIESIERSANDEQLWVISELNYADVQIALHGDGDPRASSTIGDWVEYRKSLRNRVQDGNIIGSRPERLV